MESVAVIDLLSSMPDIGTFVTHFFFFSIVFEDTWMYFEGVWSRFITSEEGIWYFSTWFIIFCMNFSSTSFLSTNRHCDFTSSRLVLFKTHSLEQVFCPWNSEHNIVLFKQWITLREYFICCNCNGWIHNSSFVSGCFKSFALDCQAFRIGEWGVHVVNWQAVFRETSFYSFLLSSGTCSVFEIHVLYFH